MRRPGCQLLSQPRGAFAEDRTRYVQFRLSDFADVFQGYRRTDDVSSIPWVSDIRSMVLEQGKAWYRIDRFRHMAARWSKTRNSVRRSRTTRKSRAPETSHR